MYNSFLSLCGGMFKFCIYIFYILYSYLVGCCPISDLFGKGEPILGEAINFADYKS